MLRIEVSLSTILSLIISMLMVLDALVWYGTIVNGMLVRVQFFMPIIIVAVISLPITSLEV